MTMQQLNTLGSIPRIEVIIKEVRVVVYGKDERG